MSKRYWIVLVHDTASNTMVIPNGKVFFGRRIPALTQAYSHKRTGRVPYIARINADDLMDFVLHNGVLDNLQQT